jgi:hypothetical protein
VVSAVDRHDRWRRREDVVNRTVVDGVLVLGPTGAEPVTLEGTALTVWQALEEPRSLDDLVRILSEQFSPAPSLGSDVAGLLVELEAAGLISQVEPG